MRLWAFIFGLALPSTLLAQDCHSEDVFQDNLNSCPFVLANLAEQERATVWHYIEGCYEAFHSQDTFRAVENTPSWWPGDGRLPIEHLQAAKQSWETYRVESCTGENTGWGGSHFKFTGNICLLRKTESRLRELHSLAQSCRHVSMTGREIDSSFAAYETSYQFYSE